MAIKYKDLYNAEVERELNASELAQIYRTEDLIDGKIKSSWDKSGGTIYIDLVYAIFKCDDKGSHTSYNDITRNKMYEILKKRFEDADWDCKIKSDNSGSMNECDYWVLTPKTIK